jgi:hypothetical protein
MIGLVFGVVMLGICVFAFLRGRADEKIAATAIVAAALLSVVAKTSNFASPETGILGIDMALLTLLTIVAMRSDRFWPLWAAGFQVVGTMIHLATFVQVEIWPPAYVAAQGFWAWPVMAALFTGTLLEARFRNR